MLKECESINYLTYEQAQDLVERIANRAENFNHTMSDNEKASMSQLLSDIGVRTSDLIDVSNLADNYAINAEIVTPSDLEHYSHIDLNDSLFQWEEEDGTYYCLQWWGTLWNIFLIYYSKITMRC